ncbi:MAG: hypothetical protein ACR2P5_00360 [Gammaproteobacteria bacterium]
MQWKAAGTPPVCVPTLERRDEEYDDGRRRQIARKMRVAGGAVSGIIAGI